MSYILPFFFHKKWVYCHNKILWKRHCRIIRTFTVQYSHFNRCKPFSFYLSNWESVTL